MDLTAFQLGSFSERARLPPPWCAGVTGFAFALIAAAVWLHILDAAANRDADRSATA